jgi:hypothetical protein
MHAAEEEEVARDSNLSNHSPRVRLSRGETSRLWAAAAAVVSILACSSSVCDQQQQQQKQLYVLPTAEEDW